MAVKTNACHLKYLVSDYIKKLHKPEDEAVSAIADLIEDLRKNKESTINYINSQTEVEMLICQLFKLLRASLPIIVGNTAFILGTLAEFENGRSKIIQILSKENFDKHNSIDHLLFLLDSTDLETVLNVTGTIGSLVESSDGRQFFLARPKSLSNLLNKVNILLQSPDLCISSNAALIIARISIDDAGNTFLLNSPLLDKIIINLVYCLTVDNAGRGMNAAFGLGRIFDKESTIGTYTSLIYQLKFIDKLIDMTNGSEMAFVKNSCFCLSSVMGSDKGLKMVINHESFNQLILNLTNLLSSNDDETIWFDVLTLKIISKKPLGCKLMRKNGTILSHVKNCMPNPNLSEEVKKECQEIINNLTPLDKPAKPNVTLISPYEVYVSWDLPEVNNGFEIKSFLYCKEDDDEILAYSGKKNEAAIKNLESNKNYEFYLKFANDIEMTISSESCAIITAEDYPSEPKDLRVLAYTSTQIKIGWDEPEKVNGSIKHYLIYMNKRTFEKTCERSSIISGLQPETRYTFSVCAVNACGKGGLAEIEVSTLSLGAHAPDRPNVIMLGRSEANLTWNPPEAPMGKIFRYEVKMNQRVVVYSGIQTYCKISNLKSDSDYSFSVVVVTSEGRYESPICRKRTGKDEYAGSHRAPLYECKPKLEAGDGPNSTNLPYNLTRLQKNIKSFPNSTNLPYNLTRLQKNIKSFPNKANEYVGQLSLRNSSIIEISKQNKLGKRESFSESPSKLQPISNLHQKSKTVISTSSSSILSTLDIYPNSVSIPSLSSTSIDMSLGCTRKSSETFVTNIQSQDSDERFYLGNKKSTDNENNSNNDRFHNNNRHQFRKIPLRSSNESIRPSTKVLVNKTKNVITPKQSVHVFK